MIKNVQLGVKPGFLLAVLCGIIAAGCEIPSENEENNASATLETGSAPHRAVLSGMVLFTLPDTHTNSNILLKDLKIDDIVEGEWFLDARTNDPMMLLPELQSLEKFEKRVLRVEIDMTVPQDTECQVFYLTDGDSNYDATRAVSAAAASGRQLLKVDVQASGLTGRLRVDPGEVAGSYVLHDLTITVL